ncbi:hypothetical protein [Rhizobium rhizophilum]|uniref:hypothetical protein n=1 Tax=Rhizobium rhizophilum TaxID=1850373 RepID=UPI0014562C57|nr:hypothetical protein [Rhizobium rhizophilum]
MVRIRAVDGNSRGRPFCALHCVTIGPNNLNIEIHGFFSRPSYVALNFDLLPVLRWRAWAVDPEPLGMIGRI